MGHLLYGFVKVIEATLFYVLASFIARYLKSPIPPIGSQAYIIFVLLWPFAYPLLRPGLHRIPIIGVILAAFDSLARSCLGQANHGEQPSEDPGEAGGAKRNHNREEEQNTDAGR